MSITVLRTADAWWVRHSRAAPPGSTPTPRPPRELLADRAAIAAAAASTRHRRRSTPSPSVSPVTAPCRVVAQMTNFASHVKDAGMNPDTVPLTFFRKSSGSISGPFDDVIRPGHVRLLDYEVEIGLVIGREMPVGTEITEDNLADYVAGLVVTNDVSARDVQLPKTQFYESQVLPDVHPGRPGAGAAGRRRAQAVHRPAAALWVNGELRQDMTVADMIYPPVQALQALTRFQRLDPGDLLLTGTPVGTALSAPPKPVEIIAVAAAARDQVEAVLPAARPKTPSTCKRRRRRRGQPWPPTTARSTSAPSARS